jgi:PD-(D/E)XK endonuclease
MPKTNAARRLAFEKKQEQLRTGLGPQKKGELAEMAFMYRAENLGFDVAKPYGNSNRYDLVVRSGQRFWKVQVKACGFMAFGHYRVNAERVHRKRCIAYTAEEIDFLAVYIIAEDAWFIIPVRAFTPRRSFCLYPRGTPDGGRYEKYREA